jgi:hypothetical protein
MELFLLTRDSDGRDGYKSLKESIFGHHRAEIMIIGTEKFRISSCWDAVFGVRACK